MSRDKNRFNPESGDLKLDLDLRYGDWLHTLSWSRLRDVEHFLDGAPDRRQFMVPPAGEAMPPSTRDQADAAAAASGRWVVDPMGPTQCCDVPTVTAATSRGRVGLTWQYCEPSTLRTADFSLAAMRELGPHGPLRAK